MELCLAEVVEATRGRAAGPVGARLGSFHTDSRTVEPAALFFALRGESLDGHDFCPDAAARGAAAVVVDREVALPPGVASVRVADTWRALYDLAGHVLERVAPLVVGVTGSNGKTSTKEMAAAVLGARFPVLKSEGNLNTETGLPLTILRLRPEHRVAVLEMGMQRPGEIARLASVARPTVGVITGIGTVQAEYFADGRQVLPRAKGELIQALPEDGLAVLNQDDPFFAFLAELSKAPVVGFGLERGELLGEGYRALPDGGCCFEGAGVGGALRLAG